MKPAPVLRYPGSKWNIAKWIIAHFPAHTVYLEPFFGSGAVFFTKAPSKLETINDIDGQVVNLFRVIRERPEELAALVEMTPWAREEHYASYELTGDPLEDARRFLVRCWQGHGSKPYEAGGWAHDTTGGSSPVPRWRRLPKLIRLAAARLRQAQIEHQPAAKLIPRYNKPNTLIYADPPYPCDIRKTGLYRYEMHDEEHCELLDLLEAHTGPVVLSGYRCELYDERLQTWRRVARRVVAEHGRTREEVLWLNPACARALGGTLFREEASI